MFSEVRNANIKNWKDHDVFFPVNLEIKALIVKLWIGRISGEDVELYLQRYCEILKSMEKPVDNLGLWYGVRQYQVKLLKNAKGPFFVSQIVC